jgi:hypothetical protein
MPISGDLVVGTRLRANRSHSYYAWENRRRGQSPAGRKCGFKADLDVSVAHEEWRAHPVKAHGTVMLAN